MRAAVAAGITCARSVTKPRGAGSGGSAAPAVRASATPSRARRLITERVDGGDDPLDLVEVCPELRAQRRRPERRLARTVAKEAGAGRERAEDALARGEDVGVAVRRLVVVETEEVAQ